MEQAGSHTKTSDAANVRTALLFVLTLPPNGHRLTSLSPVFMRTQNIQFLSIWEVAHRWEGPDPSASVDISVTSKIGERLRGLVWAVRDALNCYDVHGKFVPMETLWFGFPPTSFAKQLDKAFYDPGAYRDFLKAVFLEQDGVKKVLKTIEPLPAFWFEESESAEAEREYLSLQAPVMNSIPTGFES